MHIESDTKLDYSDVLLRPKRSTLTSRKEVKLTRTFAFPHSQRKIDVNPIIAANMDGVGTFEMLKVLAEDDMLVALNKSYTPEELRNVYSHAAMKDSWRMKESLCLTIGMQDTDYEKVRELKYKFPIICIDTPNGYMEKYVQFVKSIRELCGVDNIIIAGNVVTADQTQELILNGADVVKVGIGPGSVCTTRIVTGVGYPQLSTVIECADAAHGLGGHVVADGGCTSPGDVAKAFAAGADFVMLGGMLAGHDEGGGEPVHKYIHNNEYYYMKEDEIYKPVIERKEFRQFYGMSSNTANKKHAGGLKDYRASEGRDILVPYRGAVADTVQYILGGLRSTCTYVGAKQIKDLTKCATFVKVNNQYNKVYENA
jgi:GMP reductase